MTITITQAKSEDYLGFAEIFLEIEEFHRLNAEWKFEKVETVSRDYYNELISNPDARVFLAKDSEKVIGFIVAFKKQSSPIPVLKNRQWVEIDNLAVKTEYRKQGIGQLLTNEIESWAKKCSIKELELTVWDFNEGAQKFYEKQGYGTYSHRMRKVISK